MTLREWRERVVGVSQRDAAALLRERVPGWKVTHSHIQKWEADKVSPTTETLDLVALGTEGHVTRMDWPNRVAKK